MSGPLRTPPHKVVPLKNKESVSRCAYCGEEYTLKDNNCPKHPNKKDNNEKDSRGI